jgi:WD40 repeat protein
MSTTVFPPPPGLADPPRVFGAPTLHTDNDLLALALTADNLLWSVEEPGRLRCWNLATRREVRAHTLDQLATAWAFNWAGRLLASASDEVAVWEASSGEMLAGWAAPSWVTALAFQPGTTLLATGHDDGRVCVWDWAAQRRLATLGGHDRQVSAVAFSPDGTLLASACEGRMILLHELPGGRLRGALEGHTDRIPALAWHPDNRRLFSAGWDTTVRVWDVRALAPVILLNSHAAQVHALALSGDGALLASADSDNAVHVWQTQDYRPLAVLHEDTGEVRCLAFTPDDSRGCLNSPVLAWGAADRVIHLWDSKQGAADRVDPLLYRTVVAADPGGRRWYGLAAGADLRVWDAVSAGPAYTLEGDPLLRTFALSPDGRVLAAVSLPEEGGRAKREDRATLALYDAQTGDRLVACEGQRAPITALAFSADGALLASGGVESSDVWLWDVPSGEPALLIPDAVDDCSVEALAFQPGGTLLAMAGIDWLATGGDDGEVVLWDLASRQPCRALPGGATAVAFDPSGRVLACAGLDRSVRLFDAATGRLDKVLVGFQDAVTCLAWSPDGGLLAAAGEDRVVRLWSALGEPRTSAWSLLEGGAWELDNAVKALAFSADGKLLFTGNGNTSCYELETARLLNTGR